MADSPKNDLYERPMALIYAASSRLLALGLLIGAAMSRLTHHELYRVLRDRIEHSDNLVNQRLTWILTYQGFMFLAFFTAAAATSFPTKRPILVVLALLGIVVCTLGTLSIRGHFQHVANMQRLWLAHTGRPDERGQEIEAFPYVSFGGKWWKNSAGAAAIGISCRYKLGMATSDSANPRSSCKRSIIKVRSP